VTSSRPDRPGPRLQRRHRCASACSCTSDPIAVRRINAHEWMALPRVRRSRHEESQQTHGAVPGAARTAAAHTRGGAWSSPHSVEGVPNDAAHALPYRHRPGLGASSTRTIGWSLRVAPAAWVNAPADRTYVRVSEGGLEPPCPCGHMALNHARLPIPPLRLALTIYRSAAQRAEGKQWRSCLPFSVSNTGKGHMNAMAHPGATNRPRSKPRRGQTRSPRSH
jgi:hypothetical protein